MHLRWTEPATQDLTHICDYIEEQDGPAAAHRIALTIYKAVSSLREFLQRGRPGKKTSTRELVVTRLPYVVVYRIRDNTVS